MPPSSSLGPAFPSPILDVDEKKKKEELEAKKKEIDDVLGVLSITSIVLIYFSYTILLCFGLLRELGSKILRKFGFIENPFATQQGYAPMLKELDYFWLTRFYRRIRDLFERPISSSPSDWFDIMDRVSDDEFFTFRFTGTKTKTLNLGSYNYLGFAENKGPVTDNVAESIRKCGVATGSCRMEGGNYKVIEELERVTAEFVGKPDALVIGQGFATNSTSIPAICGGKGTLIISDSLNHNSIVCGSRDSGAAIRVFKHNDPVDLEKVIRDSIISGQPRTHRPWKKIIIIIEGIYSMEGEIARLPEIVDIKKKYNVYLYMDEAHSIGAMGPNGKGVCEHYGVNPDDVDILMGTYTKSFGSVGGYIAGDKDLIEYLRQTSYGSMYSGSMSPPCAEQALSALKLIMGKDGSDDGKIRIKRLHDNSNYFRSRLLDLGFHVFGDTDSPVIPMMIYHPAKLPAFSRELLKRGIAVVVVGFPVTPLLLTRVRFCISASHTIEDLEWAIQQIDDVGESIYLKYNK